MNLTQKKKRLIDLTRLILLCKGFDETQRLGIKERTKLKKEIQSKCKHNFMSVFGFCVECGKII